MTTSARHILSLTFFEDSGHGWLAVHMAHLRALGIEQKITGYSYRDGDIAYLEEDCDAALFQHAAALAERELAIDHTYIDGLCFVRGLPRFRKLPRSAYRPLKKGW